ncbi:hypothetical protein ACWDYJ_30575 [Streptomyces sp. NPDC003042]
MADEHNGWLDRAAAEKLLRGEPAGPAGSGADERAEAEAARLRAALDSLTVHPYPGRELPGEAAALAAFRAARGRAPDAERPAAPAASGRPLIDLPLVDLAPPPLVRIPAQRRGSAPLRFGLAAALAGVAVGGIAAVVGSGLLDGAAHHTAGPAPAVSVSVDSDPDPAGDTAGPTLSPLLRPTPRPGGDEATSSPGASRTPGTDTRTTPGATGGSPSGAAAGGTGASAGTGTGSTGGPKDLFTDKTGGGGESSGTDPDPGRVDQAQPAELCREHRAGKLTGERRERLAKLAGALAKIPRFCETLLDGTRDGAPKSGAEGDAGVEPPRAPTQNASGSLGFRTR